MPVLQVLGFFLRDPPQGLRTRLGPPAPRKAHAQGREGVPWGLTDLFPVGVPVDHQRHFCLS